MRRFLLLPVALLVNSLVIVADFSSIARSDVILPDIPSVHYCYRIPNVDRYPDYAFFAELINWRTREVVSLQRIDSKGCYRVFGDDNAGGVFAQKKQQKSSQPSTQNRIYGRRDIRLNLYPGEAVNLSRIENKFTIKSVSPKGIELQYTEIFYKFKDGRQERRLVPQSNQNRSPRQSNYSLNLWHLANSIIAIGIVALAYSRFKSIK